MVGPGSARTLVALMAVPLTVSCGTKTRPFPDPQPATDPRGTPEAVLFLVGDAGLAHPGSSILEHLAGQVSQAADSMPDGARGRVTVLFLGDVVYEDGIREGTRQRQEDLAHLRAQLEVLRSTGARGVIIPGNHDWAQGGDTATVARMASATDSLANALGVAASFRPDYATTCPAYRDVGPTVRVVILDTHAWLRDADQRRCTTPPADSLRNAITSAGQRFVVVAAHHPLVSAGTHGSALAGFPASLGEILGVSAQDLNGRPYVRMIETLSEVMHSAAEPVFAWVAGHDHSLQLIVDSIHGLGPRYHIVSGAASKASAVNTDMPGLRYWTQNTLGYIRLSFHGDEALFTSFTADQNACGSSDSCVDLDLEFKVHHSVRLNRR